MKKILALCLSLLMALSLFGCSGTESTPETTEAPKETQSPAEQEVLRVLTIGNSHTNDTTNLLYEVFHAEMPEQKVMIGNMYYSGCPMDKHVSFAKTNSAEYEYMKNDSGFWNNTEGTTLSYALKEQAWDVVILHEMNTKSGLDSSYSTNYTQQLIDYVKDNTYYDPTFLYHLPWANPVDETFFGPTYDPQPPASWVTNYQANYNMNYDYMLEQVIKMLKTYIEPMEDISGFIPGGIAQHYANVALDQTDIDLFRDYTHLSDFGRLLNSYVWFCTITGKTEITEVNVDVIPADMRHRRAKVLGDLEITDEMKQVIIQAVNYALANPWEVPAAQ
jgi:hypothetical protein